MGSSRRVKTCWVQRPERNVNRAEGKGSVHCLTVCCFLVGEMGGQSEAENFELINF